MATRGGRDKKGCSLGESRLSWELTQDAFLNWPPLCVLGPSPRGPSKMGQIVSQKPLPQDNREAFPHLGWVSQETSVPPASRMLPGMWSRVAQAAHAIDPKSPRSGGEGERLKVVRLEGPVSGATVGAGPGLWSIQEHAFPVTMPSLWLSHSLPEWTRASCSQRLCLPVLGAS